MQHCITLYRVRQHVLTLKVAYQLKLFEKLNVQCAVNVWTLRIVCNYVQADCLHINPGNSMCLLHLWVCCSVLQCVAVCCNVLQCLSVCCSVFLCVAVCPLHPMGLPFKPKLAESAVSHMWMCHVPCMNASRPTHKYIMSHMWMCPCHLRPWLAHTVISRQCASHIPHTYMTRM